jgi:transposase
VLFRSTNKTWMLHHDNAPPHASLLILEFLAKQETIVVPQPPYSPDLAPADFFLFPKLKSTLKGRRFQTAEEIKENSLQDFAPSRKTRSRTRSRTGKNAESGVSTVEGSTLKETSLITL